MDLFIQFAVAAAHLAVEDSGMPPGDLESERAGTYVGSGIGGLGSIEEWHKVLLEKGPERVSPFFLIQTIINEAAGQISIRYGAKGPNSADRHGLQHRHPRHRRLLPAHRPGRRRHHDRRRGRGARDPAERRRLQRHEGAL